VELPPIGRVCAASGRASYDAVVAAIASARSNKVAGIVTAPVNKEAMANPGCLDWYVAFAAEHWAARAAPAAC
ncbi:MAG: 4-hydroxythreonine-4-phosphate dehydrogenase PdxA, partial [Hydrogenophaga sp.]